jgi:UDP-GlcNAc:undecaprenyl-phosphate GlcNAc-1-phosphate transferase
VSGYEVPEWAGAVLTVIWLIGCTNALNLIDGLDGLAAGVGLLASVTTCIAGLLQHNIELALLTAPLIGALLGFLRYNFNPASIFLGDCGSMSTGFLLGCLAILWSQKSATLLGMIAPGIALAVPIVDTALAVVRRFLRRKPIFGADRGHIHHRLLDRGLTPRKAVLLMYAACACAAALSLLHDAFNSRFGALVVLTFCGAVAAAIQQLRYPEFEVARLLLARGAFRDHLNAHIAVRDLDRTLNQADDPRSCWTAIQNASHPFGFQQVELSLAGRRFSHEEGGGGNDCWTVRVPLSDADDYVQLTREFQCTEPIAVAPFAECLRRNLGLKLRRFRRDTEQLVRLCPAEVSNECLSPLPAVTSYAESASLLGLARFAQAAEPSASSLSPVHSQSGFLDGH